MGVLEGWASSYERSTPVVVGLATCAGVTQMICVELRATGATSLLPNWQNDAAPLCEPRAEVFSANRTFRVWGGSCGLGLARPTASGVPQ